MCLQVRKDDPRVELRECDPEKLQRFFLPQSKYLMDGVTVDSAGGGGGGDSGSIPTIQPSPLASSFRPVSIVSNMHKYTHGKSTACCNQPPSSLT